MSKKKIILINNQLKKSWFGVDTKSIDIQKIVILIKNYKSLKLVNYY